MDRLVELFLGSARAEGEADSCSPPFGGGAPDDEAIERGIAVVQKLMTSDEAIQMGGTPSATFVCLGMALEEKPMLGGAAVRCYEKGLEFLGRRGGGGWERAVVLQQLSAVGLRQGRLQDAKRWLEDCTEAIKSAPGHPRDAQLFSGAFNTKQTRMEFMATIEKMRAQVCGRMGDKELAYAHLAESQRLEQLASGDAVERQLLQQSQASSSSSSTSRPSGSFVPAASPAPSTGCTPKELWAMQPAKEVRLKEYRYTDEGPTVSVILELNEHLGIGAEASEIVKELQQFRVQCEPHSVHVQLRARRVDGQVYAFLLRLDPLCKEIVPEDTVPRLKGKEGRRRLEVKLFKRDKDNKWFGDIVSESKPVRSEVKGRKADAAPPPAKGTLLNPLTPEELARLPRPSGGNADNRPSTWQEVSSGPCCGGSSSGPSVNGASVSSPAVPQALDRAQAVSAWPAWVAGLEERPALPEEAESGAAALALLQLGDAGGEPVALQDLALDADVASGVLRLSLARDGGAAGCLELRAPPGSTLEGLVPKWRRKARILELRFLAEAP